MRKFVPLAAGLTCVALLSGCGLSEARLLLRTPAELSEGQRYRFRLAFALASAAKWIAADEFTATLDRTLARVVAFNLRKFSAAFAYTTSEYGSVPGGSSISARDTRRKLYGLLAASARASSVLTTS